jgi:nitrate/TMAO reductase-like tetraheme cytochrome c subunit
MKSKGKILLLMIAVMTIGIGMPTTFSLGSGQHQFSQIDPANPDAFCNKCHGAGDSINAELATSGNGIYNGGGRIHSELHCVDCHRLAEGYGTNNGSKTEHAATIPTCIKCHTIGSGSVLGNVTQELNAVTEAHRNFDDDVACIGCHTSVAVTGSVSYVYSNGQERLGLKIGN